MFKLSVLVIDNRDLQRSNTVDALESLGVEHIHQASSEQESMAVLAEAGRLDIVICEPDLPGLDTGAVIQQMAQARNVAAMIMFSGKDHSAPSPEQARLFASSIHLLGEIGRPLVIQSLKALLQRYGQDETLPAGVAKIVRRQKPTQAEVEQGLQAGEFNAYFQPRVCMQSGQVCGLKMFMGWMHPQRGFIKESDCLPLLESYGLGDDLFIQLLRQGLSTQQLIGLDGYQVKLAMSLPSAQLISDDLCKYIAASLALHQLPADGLMFEVRENCYLQAPTRSQANLVRLHNLGCGLAIDSFKACYSAMNKHVASTFSAIRLDAGPVRIQQQSVQKKARDNLVLSEATSQGIDIVVEGVDSVGQRSQLAGMANVTAQGRVFAAPMSTLELRHWLVESGLAASQQYA